MSEQALSSAQSQPFGTVNSSPLNLFYNSKRYNNNNSIKYVDCFLLIFIVRK
ncbi:MAG: hypothetical protein ACFFCV_01205 [Promethearchaeota archaeon]